MASAKESKPRRPPATTVEARENQLTAMAYDLAEKQIANGTVSSQVLTHFLKIGTVREELERERLRKENMLLQARTEDLAAAKDVALLYGEAIEAMRAYTGSEDA